MFDLFSWSHLLIIAIVALVVVGPKDLPRLMRIGGQWVAKARGMANEFRSSFDDMARQGELDELRKEIESLRTPLASPDRPVDHGILPEREQEPGIEPLSPAGSVAPAIEAEIPKLGAEPPPS